MTITKSAKKFFFLSGGLLIALFTFISCEMAVRELDSITDDQGNVVTFNKTELVKSFFDLGLKAYSNGDVYTEILYEQFDRTLDAKERALHNNQKKVKAYRITGFKKSTIKRNESGDIVSYTPYQSIHKISINNGLSYTYDNIVHKLVLNEYGFVDELESFQNGVIFAQVRYEYDDAGYLTTAILSRKDTKERMWIYYEYFPNHIKVTESGVSYNIPMLKNIPNTGNVCNVFDATEKSLTSKYVILPDLYYLGLYGTPIQTLPDVVVERKLQNKSIVLSRVGKQHYFY